MSIIGRSMTYVFYMWHLCKKKQHSQGRTVCGLEQIQQISDFIDETCTVGGRGGAGMLQLQPVKKYLIKINLCN